MSDQSSPTIEQVYSKPNTVTAVVSECDVEQRSYSGYVLIAVVATDVLHVAQESEDVPVTDPGYTYANRHETTSRTKTYMAREARYVMRLDPESAMAQKEQDLNVMAAEKAHVEQALADERKKITALAKERETLVLNDAELKRTNESLRQRYETTCKDRDGFRDACQKLEGDMGKVRTAVGERGMKEILGT